MLDPVAAERAERSIDEFINACSKAKKKANAEEEAWKESTRRVNLKRQRENREAWTAHHGHMHRLHLALATEHADRRSRLLAEDYAGLDEGPDGEAGDEVQVDDGKALSQDGEGGA
jgi:hypothetical protein